MWTVHNAMRATGVMIPERDLYVVWLSIERRPEFERRGSCTPSVLN